MSLSRRRMMYGLMGLAGMTQNISSLHAGSTITRPTIWQACDPGIP